MVFKSGFLLDENKKEKASVPEVDFDELPVEVHNYIIQLLDDTNQDNTTRISNKCKNVVRYCQTTRETNRHCKNTPSVLRTIAQCKQHKVLQIKASRPYRISVGPPIDTVPIGEPVEKPKSMAGNMELKSKIENIENKWKLSEYVSSKKLT